MITVTLAALYLLLVIREKNLDLVPSNELDKPPKSEVT